jgi:maltose O-acetyltransferase
MIEKILRRLKTIWLEFVTGFLWWFVGNIPSHHVRRFFYRLAGMKIAQGSTLHMGARIYDPRHIRIGQDSIIGEQAVLDGRRQLPQLQGRVADWQSRGYCFSSHDLDQSA